LFFNVAFNTLNISQGSVETQLRCGGIFIANVLLYSGSEIIFKIG